MQDADEFPIFDAILDGAVLLDKAGRIVDWNSGATTLFGYSRKEALGRSINFIYERNHPFQKIIHELMAQHKKTWTEEIGYIRKNGIKGICKTNLSALSHREHSKGLALLTHHNLTNIKKTEEELRSTVQSLTQNLVHFNGHFYLSNKFHIDTLSAMEQTEKALRESELRFHLLAQNATDIISRHLPDGVCLYVSPASKTILGYPAERLVNLNIYKFIHHDDIAKLKKAFARRKDHHDQKPVVYRIKHRNGEYRWFESMARVIQDETSKIIKEVQLASRDVTDRILDKKAHLRGKQLAHVYRLSTMEEMASGMAHEISQPLAAVINYTRGCVRHLQNNHHDTSEFINVMEKAANQAERAGEIIQRLKNFFCKGQLVKTPCKINNIIREMVSLIRNDLTTSKTKVDFTLDKNLPFISADKIQLQQVLLNLLNNALEAMHEIPARDRRIHIHSKTVSKNIIEVRVSDSGPGFSKEIITKVFKPFFSTKAHGRGMGLAICRSIIEVHGGQFIINPNTTDQSWIGFTLPVNLGED